MEQSPMLRTKDNVVHAGLSQLLVQWKELIKLRQANSSLSQSNNWLIVQEVMETKVAMVDFMTMLLTMLITILQKLNLIIHTLHMMDSADILLLMEKLEPIPTKMSDQDQFQLSPKLLPKVPYQSQYKPIKTLS